MSLAEVADTSREENRFAEGFLSLGFRAWLECLQLVDSPFASLRRLAEELGEVALKISMPRFLLSWLLNLVSCALSAATPRFLRFQTKSVLQSRGCAQIRTSILSKANFDINAVSPIDTVSDAFIPGMDLRMHRSGCVEGGDFTLG